MKKIKLFCLPHAGASAMSYIKWKKYLHPSIELFPIELAGRGKRLQEPLYSNYHDMIDDLYEIIKYEIIDTDYAFFGHSFGTLIICDLVNRIIQNKKKEPIKLFLSGKCPPHVKDGTNIHVLEDDDFINEVYKLGGIDDYLINNKEILKIFIPVLKEDYRLIETYNYKYSGIWNTDLVIINGNIDASLDKDKLREWERYTSLSCEFFYFDGGHFYINDYFQDIAKIINSKLENV